MNLTLTAKGHLTAKNLPPPIQHLIIEGVQRLPRARAKALAESLRDICEELGVADEHPPLLMQDAPAPKRARRTDRAAAKRSAKRTARRR